MSETLKCVVCETEHQRGTEDIGTFVLEGGSEETRYPVCRACHESGAHATWRAKAIAALETSPVAMQSRGNLAEDYHELQSWLKHDERISDGICPNGCARMVAVDSHNAECPVCHFGFYHNVGVTLPA